MKHMGQCGDYQQDGDCGAWCPIFVEGKCSIHDEIMGNMVEEYKETYRTQPHRAIDISPVGAPCQCGQPTMTGVAMCADCRTVSERVEPKPDQPRPDKLEPWLRRPCGAVGEKW